METITAYFSNHEPVIYTMDLLFHLITDPNVVEIINNQTGEVLYYS